MLIALFVAACLSLDVLLFFQSGAVAWPHPLAMVAVGFTLGQVALASAWLAMAPGPLLAKLAIVLASVFGLASLLATFTHPRAEDWTGVLALFALLMASPLGLLRLSGRRWTAATKDESANLSSFPRWQYSLGALTAAMTAVCFLLGAGRMMNFPWEDAFAVAQYFCGFSAVAHLALWAGAGEAFPILRVFAMLGAAPCIGAALSLVENGLEQLAAFATCALVQGACVYTGILVTRVAGYQLR